MNKSQPARPLVGDSIQFYHTIHLSPKSDRLGMPPLANRRQRVVKTHRDVADEPAARVSDFQAGRCAFH